MQSNAYTMSVPVKVNKLTKVMKSEFLNLEPLSCDSASWDLWGKGTLYIKPILLIS